jgi:sulfite exporter TauE/SafE
LRAPVALAGSDRILRAMEPCCAGLDPAEPLHGLLLLTTGLTVSLGHCLGMCGPLVVGFSAAQRSRGATGAALVRATALYHSGRILSYALLGTVLGLAGATASLAATQGVVSLAVGAAMTVLGLGLLGVLPTRTWIERSPMAGRVQRRILALLGAGGAGGHFAAGAANGFLPCGPVAVVALAAAAAPSPLRGGAALLLYGLGTVPALTLAGIGGSTLAPGVRRRLDRAASVLVLGLAVQLVLRGLAALGAVPHWRLGGVAIW